MTKKRMLIEILCITMASLLFVIAGIITSKPNKKEESSNQIPINTSSRFFDCSLDTVYKKDYQIDYLYHFYFTNNKVQYGSLKYIYTFNSKNAYDDFKIDFKEASTEVIETSNEKELTKTYDMKMQYPQEVQGEKTIDAYLEKLKKLQYTCIETTTKENK